MASRARVEGNCNYRLWTTEELIDAYAWEAKRINQEDRKRTQQLIKQELTATGFELVEDSKLLANPEDDHSWMVFAPGKRGTTDQIVLKFRKPAKK